MFFKEELAELAKLALKVRDTLQKTEQRLSCVDEYNKFLDNMIDKGFDDFLPGECLIDFSYWSEKYFNLDMKNTYKKGPPKIYNLIRNSEFIAKILVEKVYKCHLEKVYKCHLEIDAKVLFNYKGVRCEKLSRINTSFFDSFELFNENEISIIFIQPMLGITNTGRMMIFSENRQEYLISFYEGTNLWDPKINVQWKPFGGYNKAQWIKLVDFENLLREQGINW